MRVLHGLTLTVAALLLGACGSHSASDGSTGIGPTDPTTGNGAGSSPPPAAFHPMFAIAEGILPYPTDLYFVGSTDGTLRLPDLGPLSPNRAALNALDGFSTIAPITVRFSAPIDPTTLNPADVVVIRVQLDDAHHKAIMLPPPYGAGQAPRVLSFATDYSVYVSGTPAASGASPRLAQAVDSAGQTLVIEPTHPLDPSSGATAIGYLVLLTNGIKDTSGNPAVPDNDYATVRQGALADLVSHTLPPTCASVTDPDLNGVCQLTFLHLLLAQQGGLNPASVVLSFTFNTQSTTDTLNVLWAMHQATPVAPGTIAVAPTGLTTKEFLAAAGAVSPGLADVWVGKVTVPYYLTAGTGPHDTTPLTAYWTAAGPPPPGLDQTSRTLTRFNPVPLKTSDQAIPVIVGAPDALRTGCAEPPAGWPVVVFVHGIHGDRSQALAIMDAYASRCFVTVAIDMPLHGITDPTSPLYGNQLFNGSPAAALMTGERTFDLDLENNQTLAQGPDGVTDGTGEWFINLASPVTFRDNLRQSESDLLWLGHVLPTLSLGRNINGTSDVDGAKLQLTGWSLGGIVGMAPLAVRSLATGAPNSPYLSALLANGGGGFAYLGRDSPIFSERINPVLAAESGGALVPGATLYDNFMRDLQNVFDAGDPANYTAAAVGGRPILLQQVVGGGLLPDSTTALPDQYVPNSSTARLISAGNFSRFTPGQTPLPPASGAYVNLIYGWHGSLLVPADSTRPPSTAATDAATWHEMQTEAVAFALARGQVVTVGAGSPAVVQP